MFLDFIFNLFSIHSCRRSLKDHYDKRSQYHQTKNKLNEKCKNGFLNRIRVGY